MTATKKRKSETPQIGSIDLIDRSFSLLRQAGAGPLLLYYAGTFPFVLGLLFYWADMSRGAYAWRHHSAAALGIALLFVWMKVWQTMASGALYRLLVSGEKPHRSLGDWFRMIGCQAVIQSTGLIVLPLAILALVPFPTLSAFYSTVTVIGDGSGSSPTVRSVMSRAWNLSNLWPKQNVTLLWLINMWVLVFSAAIYLIVGPWVMSETMALHPLIMFMFFLIFMCIIISSPFSTIVAVNIGIALYILPWLFKTLTGIDTIFTISGSNVFNTTFIAVVCGLAHLALDPIVKTVYVLRVYYGESRSSGEDLLFELRAYRRHSRASQHIAGALIIFIALFGCFTLVDQSLADEPILEPQQSPSNVAELDQAIDEVLARSEFTWRQPREESPEDGSSDGFLVSLFRDMYATVSQWVKDITKRLAALILKIVNFFRPWLNRESGTSGERVNWQRISTYALFILLIVVAGMLGLVLYRLIRQRKNLAETVVAVPVVTELDLEKEKLSADLLPEEEWLKLARDMMNHGDYRLAFRAFYLAVLAHLAAREFVTLSPSKTDRDYQRELERRATTRVSILALFRNLVPIYQRVWYGFYEATREHVEDFSDQVERIRSSETVG